MNAPFDPGAIAVRAVVAAGRVERATVTIERPLALARRFLGRPATEVIETVGLIHAVCGVSHAAALEFAVAAARGKRIAPAIRRRWLIRLAAERLAEHLRELHVEAPDGENVEDLSEALAFAQAIARGGEVGDTHCLATVLLRAEADRSLSTRPELGLVVAAEGLGPADDAAVVAALALDPAVEAHPCLADRRPEAGPAARAGFNAAMPGATRAARLIEARAALDRLEAAKRPETGLGGSDWLAYGCTADGWGYAAVESPRGRLYYLARVAADGRLADARVLAPTEWNFQPAGPFAAALVGFRPAGDPAAAIGRLVAAFCPCVAVNVEVVGTDA